MDEDLFIIIQSMRNTGYSWKEIFEHLTYSSISSIRLAYNRKKYLQQHSSIRVEPHEN